MEMANEVQKLNPAQIEAIVDRVVPLIAAPEDHEFFRGVLFCKLESCKSSGQAAYFVSKLLKQAA
jgi:hypothetical protein